MNLHGRPSTEKSHVFLGRGDVLKVKVPDLEGFRRTNPYTRFLLIA
jgi:hypothetical protein